MDALKVIPEIFFDLIGRVVPGAVGILAYLLFSGTTWQSCLSRVMGVSLATGSPAVSILMFIGSAYAVGQLLSPAAKLVQRIGELKYFKPKDKERGAYDWLRLHHSDAGAQCAKIRAEFTMHNGLAVVFLLSALVYPFREEHWRFLAPSALVLAAVLMAYRGRTTRDTFNDTVEKFAKAAGFYR